MFKVKGIIIGLLVASAVCMASSAFAEDETAAAGDGKIVINNHAPTSLLTIGLSKGVEVRWVNPGTTNAEAQWYVVASVHSGGNQGYATAQNLTNIMKHNYNPGDPTSTVLLTIPVEEVSKELWADTNWSAQ